MIALIWTVTIIAALIQYFHQVYSRFNRHGVNSLAPFPLLGNMDKTLLKRGHFIVDFMEVYDSFPNDRFVGRYEFTTPVLVIRDLELVKKITVKDSENFLDHRQFLTDNNDPFFGRNLFFLQGQEWKNMRSTLSPAFTGAKMRVMMPFMVEVGEQMIRSLKLKIKKSGVNYVDIEAKDLTSRYANDVIASCAFGLKVDSHTNEDNKFYSIAKEASSFKKSQIMLLFFAAAFPYLYNKLKLSLFSQDSKDFFRVLVLDTMREREMRKIIRPDMMHLLMEVKKDWTDIDLIAQAVLFFIAGIDTVSSTMSFLLHELAVNPNVQEKLYQEIKENEVKNDGNFDYNSIQQMPYLDMVVSEVLRLWPPGTSQDRCCIKDYNLGRPNDQATEDYIMRKGEGLHIPVWAFHRDPQYFPNPLKFDPERFSKENKHKINPFSYLPFGLGPRNCIGQGEGLHIPVWAFHRDPQYFPNPLKFDPERFSEEKKHKINPFSFLPFNLGHRNCIGLRFALYEMKVLAYQLVRNMTISPAAKTSIPVELDANSFNLLIKGGHWVRFQSRD